MGLSPACQSPPCSQGQFPKLESHLGGLCHLTSLPSAILFPATSHLPTWLSDLPVPGWHGVPTPRPTTWPLGCLASQPEPTSEGASLHGPGFTVRPQLDPLPEGTGLQ